MTFKQEAGNSKKAAFSEFEKNQKLKALKAYLKDNTTLAKLHVLLEEEKFIPGVEI